jgi:aminopeptidase N
VKFAAVPALGGSREPKAIRVLRSIHEGQSDGRIRRQAYEAIRRLSKSGSGDSAIAQLRQDLESLRDENKKLRGRVDTLEHTTADPTE